MKCIPRGLVFAASLFLSAASFCAAREIVPLNSDWKFIKQNAGLTAPTDSWESVTIPHTWNSRDSFMGTGEILSTLQTAEEAKAAADSRKASKIVTDDPAMKFGFYRGACWYARNVDIPADWKGKRVFLRFEAASTVAKPYLNNTLLGEHLGGFTAFCYEVTNYLNYGAPNALRVEVDNTSREDLPPLSGDFNLFGGIYRPVSLIVTDPVCITPLDYASPGVYITPKSMNAKSASVEVRTLVSNGIKQGTEKTQPALSLQTQIQDASGATVAKETTRLEIPAGITQSTVQKLAIPTPHFWNGRKDPYLYTVSVRVLSGEKMVDQVVQPLGLRTVAISEEKGFLLNGKPYPVYGVNRHQDVRGKGWAITPQDDQVDGALIAEMGATAVRNAHYPQSESWHEVGDRLGLLLWDEVPLVGETRDTRAFWRNTQEEMREMVNQLYNHPSIAWWGLFNELESKIPPSSGTELSTLQALVKELDPNRLLVAATNKSKMYFNLIPDHICFNIYPYWYSPGPMGSCATQVQEVGKRIALSEYGAGGDIAHHTEGAPVKPNPAHGGPFHPEEWQCYVHEQDWAKIKNNPNLWGSFIWNMFDFTVAKRDEGSTPSLNDKGLVTHDRRFKKDVFFFYKANWNAEPMVYIASRRSTLRKEPKTEVKVYTNCPEVELKVNGRAIGVAKPDEFGTARWPGVLLQPGKNTIEVTGKSKEKPLVDSCEWVLSAPAGS
jgi:beta-galactosidase